MPNELQNASYVAAAHVGIWAVERLKMRAFLSTFAERVPIEDLEARCCPRKVEYYGMDGQPVAASNQGASQSLIGVMPLVGPITHRGTMFTAYFGGTSLQKWEHAFGEMMANPNVGAIVLDVDSPGGSVAGIAEAAASIKKSSRVKPVIAVANTWAASAAYYLASQASEVFVTPSGEVGSLGVYSLHLDYSEALKQFGVKATFIFAGEHKVEGNPYEPLSDEALAHEQMIVEDYYEQFVTAVASGRGKTEAVVKRDFGGGRMLRPQQAVDVGMADRIGTLEDAIKAAGGQLKQRSMDRAAVARRKRELEILECECG